MELNDKKDEVKEIIKINNQKKRNENEIKMINKIKKNEINRDINKISIIKNKIGKYKKHFITSNKKQRIKIE